MGGTVQPRAAVALLLRAIWLFSSSSPVRVSLGQSPGLQSAISVYGGWLSLINAGQAGSSVVKGLERRGGLDDPSLGLQNPLQAFV